MRGELLIRIILEPGFNLESLVCKVWGCGQCVCEAVCGVGEGVCGGWVGGASFQLTSCAQVTPAIPPPTITRTGPVAMVSRVLVVLSSGKSWVNINQ